MHSNHNFYWANTNGPYYTMWLTNAGNLTTKGDVCANNGAICLSAAGAGTIGGSGTQNYVAKFNNAAGTSIGNSIIFDNGTNVGIGTNSAGARLDIADNGYVGSVLLNIKADDTAPWALKLRQDAAAQDWGVYIDNNDALHFYDITDSRYVLTLDGNGNVGIGTTNPNNFKLQVNGAIGPETDAASEIDPNGFDLGSANRHWRVVYTKKIEGSDIEFGGSIKPDENASQDGAIGYDIGSSEQQWKGLFVKTVQSVFDVNGRNLVAYATNFIGGVRVETSGIIELDSNKKAVIDFDNLAQDSDLLFLWQASNKQMKDLVVILTPSFAGMVWYEKQGNKLVIFGDKEGEVSYRLTMPREDAADWSSLIEE
jgi:hypothetical protein